MNELEIQQLNKIYRSGFLAGLEEGIRRYAIWKDGEQKVGCLQKPLKEVLSSLQCENVVKPFNEKEEESLWPHNT